MVVDQNSCRFVQLPQSPFISRMFHSISFLCTSGMFLLSWRWRKPSLSSVKANLALNAKALLCYWSHKQSASQDLTKAEPQVSSKPRLTSLKVNEFVNLYKLGSAQVKVSNLVFKETSQMSPATIQATALFLGLTLPEASSLQVIISPNCFSDPNLPFLNCVLV